MSSLQKFLVILTPLKKNVQLNAESGSSTSRIIAFCAKHVMPSMRIESLRWLCINYSTISKALIFASRTMLVHSVTRPFFQSIKEDPTSAVCIDKKPIWSNKLLDCKILEIDIDFLS